MLTKSTYLIVNTALLSATNTSTPISSTNLIVAKRRLNASRTAPFEPFRRNLHGVTCRPECQIEVSNMQQLDGEYVILLADEVRGEPSADKDVARMPFSSSAAPSFYVALIKNNSWFWALMGVLVYANLRGSN